VPQEYFRDRELRFYRSDSDIVRFAGEGCLQVADNRVLVLVDEAIAPAGGEAGGRGNSAAPLLRERLRQR
jgi:hypothetical protein